MEKKEILIISQENPEKASSVDEIQDEVNEKTQRAIYSPYGKKGYRPKTSIWKNRKYPRY